MPRASWNDGCRRGASYSATVDQAALTAHLDLESRVPALPQLPQAGERLRCACRSRWRGPGGVAARSMGFVR